ncbi:NADH:flavin oxidoreductase [Parafrankia sp. BMG5.11]|nr:NADH:flavin oxidoreductase [Parafrankia sp. BMG5.11]
MSSGRFPHLLSPGRIGSLKLRNRIAVTAMGVSLSEDDGTVGEKLIAYHEEQARGGAGLIITGVTGVAWPVGSVSWQQTAISDDRFVPGLSALTERVKGHGAKIAAQLHHGGLVAAYSHARWGHPLWAPAIPPPPKGNFTDYFLGEELAGLAGMKVPEVKVLARADIDLAIEQFRLAAGRAVRAGFDGIEIHAGHGYLLSSFISPSTNTRTDEYGGNRENRMRLLLEVLAAVRGEAGPEFPVWVKLDSREVGKTGITLDDAVEHARMIEAAGADAITVTTYHETGDGKLHSQSHTPHIPAFNLPSSVAIRRAVSIPVIASGRIEPKVGDRSIGRGEIDFVSMGRKLLADPHLPAKLAANRADEVRPCIYCYTCISAIYMGEEVRCAVNPELAHETDASPPGARAALRVAVIGGGPGGMEAARRLEVLGHDVTLLERGDRLGGTLRFASLAYEPNERILDWLRRQIARSRVDVRLRTEATPDTLRSIAPDVVVVATGAVRGMPEIPGSDLPHVYSGDDLRNLMLGEESDALRGKNGLLTRMITQIGAATGATANPAVVRHATQAWMPLGKRIVIIGGELVGIELAEFLGERGRAVTVLEEAPRLGKGLTLVRRMRILAELAEHGVELQSGASEIAIERRAVRFVSADGRHRSVAADHVIVAIGARGDTSLADRLTQGGFRVHVVGDAKGVTYIEGAMHGARVTVNAIARESAPSKRTVTNV